MTHGKRHDSWFPSSALILFASGARQNTRRSDWVHALYAARSPRRYSDAELKATLDVGTRRALCGVESSVIRDYKVAR